MEFKNPKFIGNDEDGLYKGIVEQIETSKDYDILDLCNRKRNLWVFSIVSGYRQIGQFKVNKPHNFNEGDLVIAKKENNKITDVKKETIEISNINEIFGYGAFKEK